jgi:oligopeptide/dipeptide ABC transporter ATP-binding protein
MRIGSQVAEALRIHREVTRREAWDEAVRLLGLVALPEPARQARAYPHELSGGMKQRAMLAIALSCSPALLVADEPTTALDVTVQAQILALLRGLRKELGLTLLLITHDLGVVAENADRVGVMYAGRLVEESPVAELFADPRHPYTRGLLRSMPGGEGDGTEEATDSRRLQTLPGSVPDPARPPRGCRFHPRCTERLDSCSVEEPPEIADGDGRRVACVLHATAQGAATAPAGEGENP